MGERHCDILVVGAGPAGAAAARAAAGLGASVLIVERRRKVGVPVQCAEYIPAMLLGKLNLGREFVAQSVRGMKTFRPHSPETVTRAPGFVIHRDRFDQALVRAAEEDGARVMLATRAVQRLDSGVVILKQSDGQYVNVRPRLIIGADGPHSTVGRWVGGANANLLPGAQVTMELARPLDHTEVYFQPRIFAGYGWLFPKGEVANVGLGLRRSSACPERIRTLLDEFVAGLVTENKIKGRPLGYAAGWIPAEAVRQTVFGSVALVGDAAGHTHPITGAGIFTAVIGGRMAGKWAGRAIQENDVRLLGRYDAEWRDLMGDSLDRACERRRYMEAHWDEFDATVQKCWVAYRAYYA